MYKNKSSQSYSSHLFYVQINSDLPDQKSYIWPEPNLKLRSDRLQITPKTPNKYTEDLFGFGTQKSLVLVSRLIWCFFAKIVTLLDLQNKDLAGPRSAI